MKKIIGINLLIITIIIFFSCESTKMDPGAKMTTYSVQSFPLSSVRIKEGPFLRAEEADLKYILELKVDRLLAPFLISAGFKPKDKRYPNWESTGLDGHIGGHYLSSLSLMYAATKNEELIERLEYMIDWLEKCQKKNGNGYVGGIPGGKSLWKQIAGGKIRASGFSLNGKWVPWYNLHKLFAGLRDAYLIAGNKKALTILVGLSDWCIALTKDLTEEQMQKMLQSEHGGMNEVLLDVAEITGQKKYITLAKRFSHKSILNSLIAKENKLTGLHANTQIPKVIGYKRIGDYTGDKEWSDAAAFFWSLIIDNWTISIGGNSVSEHWNPPNTFSSMITSNQGPETCNTYNMLRLTKLLFQSNPDNKYMDFYERAVFNHILSTEHPEKGGFVYFTSMRPRHYRVYSQPQQCFWCCVGSGLENHAKYGEMIYAHKGDDIFINLFLHSTLNWEEKGIRIEQVTKFPFEEKTLLKIELDEPEEFALKIRCPGWVKDGEMKININGEDEVLDATSFNTTIGTSTLLRTPFQKTTIGPQRMLRTTPSSYVSIHRKWESGDEVHITLPMKTSIEYLPDGSSWVSFLNGPIVLGAITGTTDLTGLFADSSRMGHVAGGTMYPLKEAPHIVSENKDFIDALQPVKGKPMTFKFTGNIYPEKYGNIELVPFFTIHEARYMVYFNVVTPGEFEKQK